MLISNPLVVKRLVIRVHATYNSARYDQTKPNSLASLGYRMVNSYNGFGSYAEQRPNNAGGWSGVRHPVDKSDRPTS